MLPDDTNAKTITFYLPEIENDKGQIYISLAYKYLGKDGKETTGGEIAPFLLRNMPPGNPLQTITIS